MSSLSDFEKEVIEKLAILETRTECLTFLESDVNMIKGKVGLLEFKASAFGAAAGAVILVIKNMLGKS